jgi:hypothetical protein
MPDLIFYSYWEQYIEAKKAFDELSVSNSADIIKATELNAEIIKYRDLILGHPDSFEKIRCWLVSVCIKHSEQSHILLARVKSFMTKYNLTSTWECQHISTNCTEEESKRLCTELYSQFYNSIECGTLSVERKFNLLNLITD